MQHGIITQLLEEDQQADFFLTLVKKDWMTRTDFCLRLGIHTRTLYRWEREIIAHSQILNEYLTNDFRKNALDKYQRLVVILIHQIKFDSSKARKFRTNKSVRTRLNAKLSFGLSRKNFCIYWSNKDRKVS